MENINISVGLELDKSQFNEKYVQGAIDDSVKNARLIILSWVMLVKKFRMN